MANNAKTNDFFIGDLDIRVSGTLTKAGKLGPADSIGLLQDAKVTMATNQVKLQAGFPQRTYATAVTSRDMTIEGSLSEFSIANLAMIYGDTTAFADAATATPVKTTLSAGVIAAATALNVTTNTGFAVNDPIMIYSADAASDAFVTVVTALVDTDELTIGVAVPRAFAAGAHVAKITEIKLGSSDNIPPLTIQVVGVMPLDGTPFVYDIWKGTISGTAEVAASTDNFGAMSFTLEPLQPTTKEIDCGVFGNDAVIKAVIKKFPMGRLGKTINASSC